MRNEMWPSMTIRQSYVDIRIHNPDVLYFKISLLSECEKRLYYPGYRGDNWSHGK